MGVGVRKYWWTIPSALLCAVVFRESLSGQSYRAQPSLAAPAIQLMSPEFETETQPAYQTPVVPIGHTEFEPVSETVQNPEESVPAVSWTPPGQTVEMSPELAPYIERAETIDDEPIIPISLAPLPLNFTPWWMKGIGSPLRKQSRPLQVTVDALTYRALEHSPQVLAMNLDPTIRQTDIFEEQAAFDWQAFVDSAFDANSDPVGNTLTTGGSPRFRDRIFGHTMGFRRRTTLGGEIEASQKFGFQDNNSRFFVPTQQGTSILTLSFTQPLLARSGRVYNTSRIAMAHLDTAIAENELVQGLQDHLIQVAEAYWELYRSRATLQQKLRLLARAEFVLEILEARKNVDAQARQILRARAAVASRRSEIARASMSIRNAESQLRMLVNDPELLQGSILELLPHESPLAVKLNIPMGDSLVTAIQNRPEIFQALNTVRNTSLQVGMAESEYKPTLDLVLGTYVSGLEGESDVAQSFVNQFNQGEPGWSVGVLFDLPLGRRAARARLSRKQLEMQKAMLEFRTAVEMTLTETEMAVREVRTTYQEMLSTFEAMNASETEAQFLYERWRLLVGSERSTTLLLEDLLDAQMRVADEEANFTSAQVGYVIAIANLKRAMGVLLSTNDPGPFFAATEEPLPEESQPIVPSPEPPTEPLPSHPIPLSPQTKEPMTYKPVAPPVITPEPRPLPKPEMKTPPRDLPPLPIPITPGHSRSERTKPSPGHSQPRLPSTNGPTLTPLPN